MLRLRFIPLVLVLLATACVSPALAVFWTGSNGEEFTWTEENGVWTLDLDLTWAKAWGVGGGYQYTMSGNSPCIGDPWVIQEIYNDTDIAWTDWHINITNAHIDNVSGNIAFCEEADDPVWNLDYLNTDADPEFEGLFAYVESGHGTQIDPGESLYIKFSYTCTNPNTVFLSQYPTSDIPIPEPASILGLLFGLATCGFGIRRRK